MIFTKVTLKMTSKINDPFTSYHCFLLQYTHQQTQIILPPQQLHSHSTLFFLKLLLRTIFLEVSVFMTQETLQILCLGFVFTLFVFLSINFCFDSQTFTKTIFYAFLFPLQFFSVKD